MNPFFLLALKVYQKRKIRANKNPKLYRELSQLYPMKDTEELYVNFQVRKLTSAFIVLTIGTVSAIFLHLCSRMEGRVAEGAQLIRNEWGAGDYEIKMRAKADEWSREIPILVEERKLTEKEREELFKNINEILPEIIKKDNHDLDHVTGDLYLPSTVPGYPLKLTWNSENKERVGRNGNVNRIGIGEKGEEVKLTATILLEEERKKFEYDVFLLPESLAVEELFFRSLEDLLIKTNLEREDKKEYYLPGKLDGIEVVWEEIKPDNSIFLFILTLFISVLICKGMEKDLEKNCKKRNRQLIIDYPGFVSKLRLYLQAGLTIKNSFLKITTDYQNQKGRRCYLYEEMKVACYQLENGVMEEQVYQDWGKRCGVMRYRRLSFLLAVNLKQGNSRLLLLLEQEADSAQEDRRNLARKAGEEAGTRLMLPMMLMLVVVMFLVLLPAYMDFGGI